jgi:hypothetical protein
MTELIISGSLAVLVLGFIVVRAWKIHTFTPVNSVIAKTIQEAKEIDGYWPGKPGYSFTQADKQAAFKRSRGRCERKHCRARTFFGNADEPGEHLKAIALGYIRGVGGHRVPKSHGGGKEKLGPIWLCDKCNSSESDDINEFVIAEVKREGKKIFI